MPQRFRPFGCPVLWGRDCKGSNLFSSDQIRRKKSPVPETDSSSFALFATVLHHAWQNPYFRVATAKVITYFLLTKSFGKILFFLRRFFALYPYNKQIFFRSNCPRDSGGTSCSENPYRISRLGIKKRSVLPYAFIGSRTEPLSLEPLPFVQVASAKVIHFSPKTIPRSIFIVSYHHTSLRIFLSTNLLHRTK